MHPPDSGGGVSEPAAGLSMTDVRSRLEFLSTVGHGLLESGLTNGQAERALTDCGRRLRMEDLSISAFGRMLILEASTGEGATVSSSGAARSLDAIDCTRSRELGRLARLTVQAEAAHRPGASGREHLAIARQVADRLRDTATPWWIVAAGMTMLAFFICMQVGVSWQAWVTAALVQAASSLLGLGTSRLLMPRLFAIALQSTGAGVVATLLVQGQFVDPVGAAAAIAVNWLLLLPLPQVIGAVTDAIDGDHLSAATRVASAAVAAFGIVIGGTLTFALGEALGMEHPRIEALPAMPWYLVLVFSALGAVANSFANGGRLDLVAPAAFLGIATGAVNQALLLWAGLPPVWAASLAAALLGLLSARIAARTGYPSQVLALMGVTGALLPGIPVFFGIVQQMGGAAGLPSFITAGAVSLGIGTGVALGGYLSRLWERTTVGASASAAVSS